MGSRGLSNREIGARLLLRHCELFKPEESQAARHRGIGPLGHRPQAPLQEIDVKLPRSVLTMTQSETGMASLVHSYL